MSEEDPLRVLLVTKTLVPRASGEWKHARAPWALGALTLRAYVQARPELAKLVHIDVRSYPTDESNELILAEIHAARPAVVGFTCQPWNQVEHARLGRIVRRLLPDAWVLHGGPMVIHLDRYLRRHGPDSLSIAVEGEAEETFAELLEHLVHGTPELSSIAGIGFFDEHGEPVVTRERDNPEVSRLPPVMSREHLDQVGSYVLYETSRGCPFRCSFCNWGSQKAKLRARSREVIEQDLRAILGDPRVKNVWLTDAGVDVSSEHATFLADVIRRYKRKGTIVTGYFFLLHADLSYVSNLVGAFDTLQLGLQSANEVVLSELGRKPLSPQRFDRILAAALPQIPDIRVDLMFGLPGVGLADLQHSVRFLADRGIEHLNLFRAVAIPGTDLADNPERYGLVADEAFPFNIYAATGCSPDELFAMLQFKAGADTLRPLFRRDRWAKARAAGLDIVDFASRLAELVPRFHHIAQFDREMQVEPDDDLRRAVHDAAARYLPGSAAARVLGELVADAYGPRPLDPARDPAAPPPAGPRRERAPSAALCGLTAAMERVAGKLADPRSLEALRPQWEHFLTESPHLDQLGVHVHVPYCQTICTYCDCATEKLAHRSQLDAYLDALGTELTWTAPTFSGRKMERLYVGGGTPNILSAAQLGRLLRGVRDAYAFADDAVLCVEANPAFSDAAKLAIAREHGVNRVSLGVQSGSEAVLRRVNRGDQTRQMVERAVEDAHRAGFPEINVDFVFGLADEPVESFVEGIAWALALAPHTVCIQLLNDSHYASPYLDDAHRARVARDFARASEAIGAHVARAAPAYDVGRRPDVLVLVRRGLWRRWDEHLEYYSARDRTWRSTIGHGRHAQSVLFGRLRYQNRSAGGTFNPASPSWAAGETTLELECVLDVVAAFEGEGRASLAPLVPVYGDAIVGRVRSWLDELEQSRHLARDGEAFVDVALDDAAMRWLARHATSSGRAATDVEPLAEALATLHVKDGLARWSIVVEKVRAGGAYYRSLGPVGLHYRFEPGAEPQAARADAVMRAAVQQVEGMLAIDVPEPAWPEELLRRLAPRMARAGMSCTVDGSSRRRNRLTVLAPS